MKSKQCSKNEKMPPSIEIGEYSVSLDILILIVALVLIFEGDNITHYLKAMANLPQLGWFLLAMGLVLFVLGRLRTD